jgi:hypothetical protein
VLPSWEGAGSSKVEFILAAPEQTNPYYCARCRAFLQIALFFIRMSLYPASQLILGYVRLTTSASLVLFHPFDVVPPFALSDIESPAAAVCLSDPCSGG